VLTNKRKKFAAWWAAWRSQHVSVEQERHGRDWLRQTQSTRLSRFRAREKRLWCYKWQWRAFFKLLFIGSLAVFWVIVPLDFSSNKQPTVGFVQNHIFIIFPCDTVHKCGLWCCVVAGWMFVTFVYCVKMAKYSTVVANVNRKLYPSFQMVPFSWPWVTHPYFKVMTIFSAEYVVNGTRQTHLGLQWITSKTLHTPYSSV